MSKGKVYSIALHCAGWIVFFSLPFIFIFSQSANNSTRLFSGDFSNTIFFAIYIAIFYLHTYFLFPELFFRKRKLLYFLSVAGLLVLVTMLQPFDRLTTMSRTMMGENPRFPVFPRAHQSEPSPLNEEHRMPPRQSPPPGNMPMPFGPPAAGIRRKHIDIISIELFIVVIAISIALILEKRWRIAIQETARAEADKVNAELSFLKAQINPHFLFNTLNNIYSLAITKNENVADAIMKLSNIMRYVTDDVNEDYVSLEKELDSISDYISLQRLRLGKKAGINFIVEGDISSKVIAPLILMPFVENVFKHGISNSEESNIIIRLTAAENEIVFYTQNKLFATPRHTDRTGIGNTNTKKKACPHLSGKTSAGNEFRKRLIHCSFSNVYLKPL